MSTAALSIHDRARQMVAQSPRPMELSEAYSKLAKRRRNYGKTKIRRNDRDAFANVEPPAWLPYRDD